MKKTAIKDKINYSSEEELTEARRKRTKEKSKRSAAEANEAEHKEGAQGAQGGALTELVFILDRSGSMCGMEADTVGGFNSMISKQRLLEGEAYVTTVLFSNESEIIHDRISLAEVPELTRRDYIPYGSTALLDAIASTVTHISDIHRYIRAEDRPARTVFVITTDGMENASRSYSAEQVRGMIREKEALGWEFLFLAANIDAIGTAEGLGIRADRAASYSTEKETLEMFDTVSDAVTLCRKLGKIEDGWSEPLSAKKGKKAGKRSGGLKP